LKAPARVRVDPNVTARILSARSRGMTYRAISDALNGARVPTARRRGPWNKNIVRHVVVSRGGGVADVVAELRAQHARLRSWQLVAERLNAYGKTTPGRGRPWTKMTARQWALFGNGRVTAPGPPRGTATHCQRGHPFDRANTYVDVDGRRHCRACARASHSRTRRARLLSGVRA
jgi:hypothetical protein